MTSVMRIALLLLALVELSSPSVRAYGASVERIAERGPATFVVGTAFVFTSLVTLPIEAATGGDTALATCRLGHGAKMAVAGTVLLPAGLLAAPLHPSKAATGFADSLAEAFQEDTCSRPVDVILP